jgi:hypothetical protein
VVDRRRTCLCHGLAEVRSLRAVNQLHHSRSRHKSTSVLIVDFTKCLEATSGDMTSCGYYLEALSKCSCRFFWSSADLCRGLPGCRQAILEHLGRLFGDQVALHDMNQISPLS